MPLSMTPLNSGSYFVVTNSHCQYFNTADVDDVVDYLPVDVMYTPTEVSSQPYNGFTWLKFTLNGQQYYTVYLKDRMKLVTNQWIRYRSEGIDVSRYQGTVDFNQVKAAGYEFVIARVVSTNTSIYIDPYFEQHIQGAKAAGLQVGAYIYTYARNTATLDAEIEKAYQVLTKYKYEYPIFLDYEDPYIQSNGKTLNTQLCRHGFEKLMSDGFYPGLYTGHVWSYTYIDAASLSDYPLWLAHWTTQTNSQLNYSIWQYGGATVPGVSGACDVNHGYIDLQPYITWNNKNGLSPESSVVPVTSVSLSPSSLSLEVGQQQTVLATIEPPNATDQNLSWESTTPNIASVDAGLVTALSAGITNISAISTNGKSATCAVEVTEPEPDPGPDPGPDPEPEPTPTEYEELDVRICPRYDSETAWLQNDPIPLFNEICVVEGIGTKYGDGVSKFSELPYQERALTEDEIDSAFDEVFGEGS